MQILRAILAELRLFFTRPSWLSEVASGLTTFCWGILVLISAQHATDWPSLDLMLRVSNSSVWGALGIVLGIGQMGVCRSLDRNWDKPWLRWGGAMLAAWIWVAMTVSAAGFWPWPPNMAANAGFAGINVYLIFRTALVRG